jgi:uncharacterized membrane-anchored protein
MKRHYYLVVAFQLLLLMVLIVSKQYTLWSGETVVLKVPQQVDPLSLFRGNYIILSYDISNLNLDAIGTDSKDFKRNDVVYVRLRRDGNYWTASEVSKKKPAALSIKGQIDWANNENIGVVYGIENYFIEQRKAAEIEGMIQEGRRKGEVTVEVKIDGNGNAVINRILLGGEPLDI